MAETAVLSRERSSIGLSWPVVAAIFACAATLLSGPHVLTDPDTLWQIVTGNWILEHGAVPRADFFSYTHTGAPWVVHEWLADMLLAIAYDAMGWHGLATLTALAAAASLGIMTRAMLRWMAPLYVLLVAVLAWLMLMPHLLARPHILALPLMVAWVAMLVEARAENRAPPLPYALLMTVWANLHGTFLFGLGLTGLLAVEALIQAPSGSERRKAARGWGLFLLLSVLAPLVSPNGIESYLLPLRLLGMNYTLSILVEWQSPNFGMFEPLELWLLGALAAGLGFGLRLPAWRMAILLLLVHMALRHWRHGELLGFAAPILLAPAIGAQLGERMAGAEPSPLGRRMLDLARPAKLGGVLLGAAILALVTGLATAMPLKPPDRFMPEAAVRAALAHKIAGPVLNDYGFGGYLIFAGVPTFVDGRADMYGDAFIEREHKAVHLLSGELPKLLDEYKIGWTLMPPDRRAVVLLDHLPGWRRLYADDIAVVHVRTTPAGQTR